MVTRARFRTFQCVFVYVLLAPPTIDTALRAFCSLELRLFCGDV